MAGRVLSLRALRSLGRQWYPSHSTTPLTASSSLLSHSVLSCRFFSGRRASPNPGKKERSLIEDEAELSDWIGDLKTDSLRLGLSSDSDEDSGRRSGRGGGSAGKFKGRERFGREERNSKGSVRSKGRGFHSEDENDEGFSSWRERGSRGRGDVAMAQRGIRGGSFGGRNGGGRKDFDFSDKDRRGSRKDFDFLDKDRRGSRKDFDFSDKDRRGSRKNFDFSDKDRRGSRKDFDFSDRSERSRGSQFGQKGRSKGLNLSLSADESGDDSDEGFSSKQRGKNAGFDLSDEEFGKSESDNDDKEGFEEFGGDVVKDGKEIMNDVEGSVGEDDSYLSQKRFDECSLSQLTLKGVKSAGYERMTIVQEATLPVILKGKDVLAKAKTGTGKTVAFLLPAIELVAKLPPVERDERKPPINVLVVCPTRELADQAAQEAVRLVKHHSSIGVQLVIGGTRLALEQKRMHTDPCQILVATPGRLRDHIENTPGFATRLRGVKVLVLDEADRLLDMGFRVDIEKIVDALPKQRQTLLFSATVPDEVRQICYMAMKRDLEFINTVKEGSEETHSQVKQMHVVAPLEKQFQILYGLLNDHISENVDYKVIVFCTTAMVTKLVAEYLAELKLNVREIHSRKPQNYRTRISKEFRESKGIILVSSDVSARGVDYPNVTLVIQLGVPADREQYIHRVGRTGRKGREGTGILILAPWEAFFLRSIQDLPITEAPLPLIDPEIRKKVVRALAHVDTKDKESAYQAWLGYYNSNKNVGRDKYQLVSLANEFSRSIGLDNPPALPKLVLRKMGLTSIPGLRSR